MATEWYYSKGEAKHGPVSPSQLKELAAAGKIQATDLVWKDGMADWVPASKVKGLVPELKSVGPPQIPQTRPNALIDSQSNERQVNETFSDQPETGPADFTSIGVRSDRVQSPKKFGRAGKFGLVGAGVAALIVFACCGGLAVMSGGKRGESPGDSTGHSPKDTAINSSKDTAIQVNAVRLFADYEANEVAADEKYKGKILKVTGIVGSIEKDFLDTIFVTLTVGGQSQIFTVQCYFGDKNKAEAAKLSKGQPIVIRGRCNGKTLNVEIKDCTFEH